MVVRTALLEAYFFSVETAPARRAALRPVRPLTTVSRGPPAPPRTRLPILVAVSQSSDIFAIVCGGVVGCGVVTVAFAVGGLWRRRGRLVAEGCRESLLVVSRRQGQVERKARMGFAVYVYQGIQWKWMEATGEWLRGLAELEGGRGSAGAESSGQAPAPKRKAW